MESTASCKHQIKSMDTTDWSAKVTAFRRYLATCNQALAVSRNSYKDDNEGHKDRTRHKEQKSPSKALSSPAYQSQFVYVLPAGADKAACEKSKYRGYCAPLWATIEDEQTPRKRRKVA